MKEKINLILDITEVETDGKKHLRVETANRDELIIALCHVLSDFEADHQLFDVITTALTMVLGAKVDTKESLDEIFEICREQALLVYDDAAKWRENKAKEGTNRKEAQCS